MGRDLTEVGSSGASNNFETKPSKPGELRNLMSLNFETAPGRYGGGSRNPYDQQGRGFDPKWDGGTNFKRRLYKGIGVDVKKDFEDEEVNFDDGNELQAFAKNETTEKSGLPSLMNLNFSRSRTQFPGNQNGPNNPFQGSNFGNQSFNSSLNRFGQQSMGSNTGMGGQLSSEFLNRFGQKSMGSSSQMESQSMSSSSGFDLRQNSGFRMQNNFQGSNSSFRGSLGQGSRFDNQYGGFRNEGGDHQNFQQRSQPSGQFWDKMHGNAYRGNRRRF